jgi:hypothetical protein
MNRKRIAALTTTKLQSLLVKTDAALKSRGKEIEERLRKIKRALKRKLVADRIRATQ